jgi:hypothetical protein
MELEFIACYRFFTSIAYNDISNTIEWIPNDAAQALSVMDHSSGSIKWLIISQNGFNSPIVYGSVPAGAEQIIPESGGIPVQIQPDDFIIVNGTFTDNGYDCYWSGSNFGGYEEELQ